MTYIDISTLITHAYVSLPVPSQSSPSKPKKLKSSLEFYQGLLQSLPEQDSHQSFKKALEDLDVSPEEKKLVVKLHRSVVMKLSLRETLRIALNDPKRFIGKTKGEKRTVKSNAYQLFLKEYYSHNSDLPITQRMKEAGVAYRGLSEKEKEKYKEQAKKINLENGLDEKKAKTIKTTVPMPDLRTLFSPVVSTEKKTKNGENPAKSPKKLDSSAFVSEAKKPVAVAAKRRQRSKTVDCSSVTIKDFFKGSGETAEQQDDTSFMAKKRKADEMEAIIAAVEQEVINGGSPQKAVPKKKKKNDPEIPQVVPVAVETPPKVVENGGEKKKSPKKKVKPTAKSPPPELVEPEKEEEPPTPVKKEKKKKKAAEAPKASQEAAAKPVKENWVKEPPTATAAFCTVPIPPKHSKHIPWLIQIHAPNNI